MIYQLNTLQKKLYVSIACLIILCSGAPVFSYNLTEPSDTARALLIPQDPSLQVLPSLDNYFHRRGEQAPDPAMQAFLDRFGRQWDVFWDTRSDRPDLVSGQGIPFVPGAGNTLDTPLYGQPAATLTPDTMADTVLRFIEDHPDLLRIDPASLEMDPVATRGFGENNRLWFVHFKQIYKNLEVKNARVFFRINSGNITQFGAHQFLDIPSDFNDTPSISAGTALDISIDHALTAITGNLEIISPPALLIAPVFSEGRSGRVGEPYRGVPGEGYGARLVWEMTFRLEPHIETWYAMVDAHSGEILHFHDDNKYGSIYGGVYFDDNIDPETEAPFPYAQTDQGVGTSGGRLDYPGGSVTCSLNGQYVQISDTCGSISLTSPDGDLGFGLSPDTNCSTPGYGGSGNTRASRTSFYHANDVIMKARGYLPDNTWLQGKLLTNVNINNTCNAFWNGSSINFYRDGSGCSNTGELAPVVLHEWGHGLDYNTGTTSNDSASSEALADAMSFMQTHISCTGHNFRPGVPCKYGCDESCTGVRDSGVRPFIRPDNMHIGPANCAEMSCPYYGYAGVMGYQGHCESLIASGAVWDTAVKMADAMGGDAGWSLANRIFFETMGDYQAAYRIVSGGQCNPDAEIDGCGSDNWYTVWLFADDDNGNLADGTPNGCHIWDAFTDHGIACGDRPDCYSECPPLAAPDLVLVPGDEESTLSWEPVPDASYYIIFRNTSGCEFERSIIGTTSETYFTDDTVTNDLVFYYSVQAAGTNDACRSPMSACLSVEPGLSSDGVINLDKSHYGDNDTIIVQVGDLDLQGYGSVDITIESDSEPAGEIISLTETGGPTGIFTGSIMTTISPGITGKLTIADQDDIHATYFDEDIGDGTSADKIATARGDLTPPVLSNIVVSFVTTHSFTVTWNTDEAADSVLFWGDTVPPPHSVSDDDMTVFHELTATDLDACTDYYFMVQSTDIAGNTSIDDNGGLYYSITTLQLMVLLEETMDTDPGWTYENLWEWGPASGVSGNPPSGYTGTHITGYNLTGNYQNSLPVAYMTTTPFDCSSASQAYLGFWRWLGVESATWDHASIEISNDGGTSWDVVWEHTGGTLQETQWSYQEYDITDWAAGYGDVRLRWGMGPSDSVYAYCGWNIDDVLVSYTAPCNVPLLVYGDHTIDDSAGNNDGWINGGETIAMTVTLNNVGLDATNVSGTLSTTNPNVTITSPSVTFPDIPQSGGGTSLDAFVFDVDPSAGDGEVIPFTLAWTSEENSGSTMFSEMVVAPSLMVYEYQIEEVSGGTFNGIWEPGETIDVHVTVKNTGAGTGYDISGVLSSNLPAYVTIETGTASWPDIPAGGSAVSEAPHFRVTAAPDTPDPSDVLFTVDFTAEGYTGQSDFTIDCTFSNFVRRYHWNLDTDPEWTTEDQWAWGEPAGLGGDPSSGYTGTNVYGYNLMGTYTNYMPETNLTTGPIDCTGFQDVEVRFMRWLGIESSQYDHAYFRVSNDGANWTTIWSHTGSTFTDPDWQEIAYDISAVADNEPAVYLRWVMGTTDVSVVYCGWNIDDVEIWADIYEAPPTATPTHTPTPTATPTIHPTVTPAPPTHTPTPDCIHHGDVNFDGVISAGDAQLAFMITLGQIIPTYEEECAADCNGDGVVSAADAQLIFLTAIGSGNCVDPL